MDEKAAKENIRACFDLVSSGYDCASLRFFSNGATLLPEMLELEGHERLLDLATGTGHGALALAQSLPQGEVVGVDLSARMIEQARQKAAQAGLANASFHCLDVDEMAVERHSFHHLVCCFALFFLPRPVQSLQRLRGAIKPGGKVLVSSFSEQLMQPLTDTFYDDLISFDIEPPQTSWKRMDNEEKMQELLAEAGLEPLRVERQQLGYFLSDEEAWWQVVWNAGYRGLLLHLAEEELAAFKAQHLANISRHRVEQGIWLDVDGLFALGRCG